jgi:hypothetical protein
MLGESGWGATLICELVGSVRVNTAAKTATKIVALTGNEIAGECRFIKTSFLETVTTGPGADCDWIE